MRRLSPGRIALHVLLLLGTLLTTTIAGTALQRSFDQSRPVQIEDLISFAPLWRNPASLAAGLPFSLCLLIILLAHEMGHYVECVRYGIDASLPYFLPAPTLIGTLGAFIRIRSPIYSRRALFDIGVAGPIAGFVMLVPVLAGGLALSKVQPGIAAQGDFLFGTPALLRLGELVVFPGVPLANIYLHPIARSAWVGLLATALNLLPIGQLDGGHILYALLGERHRLLSRIFVAALVPLGLFYSYSWLLWAAVLFFFALRHPVIYDDRPLSRTRLLIAACALGILLLSFTAVPLRSGP